MSIYLIEFSKRLLLIYSRMINKYSLNAIILLNLISIPIFKSFYTTNFPIPIIVTALAILNCLLLLLNFKNLINCTKLNVSNSLVFVILCCIINSIFGKPFYTDISNFLYSFSFFFVIINFQKHSFNILKYVSGISLISILGYFLFREEMLIQRELFFNVNRNVFSSYILILDILIITRCILNDKLWWFDLFVIYLSFLPLYLNQSRIAIILFGLIFISLPIKYYVKITVSLVALAIAVNISTISLKKNLFRATILFCQTFQRKFIVINILEVGLIHLKIIMG